LEVSGQLHAPAAVPPGKCPRYPLDRRSQSQSGRFGHVHLVPRLSLREITRPLSTYVIMGWSLIKHRDNFVLLSYHIKSRTIVISRKNSASCSVGVIECCSRTLNLYVCAHTNRNMWSSGARIRAPLLIVFTVLHVSELENDSGRRFACF
jgi:hypothetical protein